jgi:hypothetical protein
MHLGREIMKQLLALIACGILTLTLTACGESNNPPQPAATEDQQIQVPVKKTDGDMKKDETGSGTESTTEKK